MFLLKKGQLRLLLLPKFKSDPGFGSDFSEIFDSRFGSKRKTQNPAESTPALRIHGQLCFEFT